MKRQLSYKNGINTLFLIPTPIGNLEDMTFRSIKTLKEVDVIFAEDTRVSGRLLKHFEIKTKLMSYHEHNKEYQGDIILSYLEEGLSIGLITDAGMPIISDPGFDISKKVIDKGFNVVALPGASAFSTALVGSGLAPSKFSFYGFLDHTKSKKRKMLETIKEEKKTLIFYESPKRVNDTLQIMYDVFGDRFVVVAREISKLYEEYIRGTLSELLELEEVKGEIVLIVEGNNDIETFDDINVLNHVAMFISKGMSEKEAIKSVAKARNLPKNTIYMEYHNNKKND